MKECHLELQIYDVNNEAMEALKLNIYRIPT